MMQSDDHFLNPRLLLEQLAVTEDQHVGDFGCGSGHLTAELALAVGKGGRVYAVDIDAEPLSQAKTLVKQVNMANVNFIQADLLQDKLEKIPVKSLDLIFFSNFFHVLVPESARQIPQRFVHLLQTEGKLVVIEWRKIPTLFGPPLNVRIEEAEMIKLFEVNGFTLDGAVSAGIYHYGLVFKVKDV